jgi:hypothetical protein
MYKMYKKKVKEKKLKKGRTSKARKTKHCLQLVKLSGSAQQVSSPGFSGVSSQLGVVDVDRN